MTKRLFLLDYFRGTSSKNKTIALSAAALVMGIGILFVATHASGFFSAGEPENGSVSGNASIVSDAGASGGKAIKFNAPVVPPPGGGGGGGGGTTPPPPSGSTTTCPLPAYPGATCTGVPAGTSLSVVNGEMTVSADNAVVSGKDVRGCIVVTSVGVTIKNSKAQCIYNADSRSANPANSRLTIQDVEIVCGGVNAPNNSGISGANYTVYRANVSDCENGFDADTDVSIYDSYIHDLYNAADGPNSPHTDGFQSAVGSNIIISHNTIYGFDAGCHPPNNGSCNGTSSINICNSTGSNCAGIHNTTISDNLLAGGTLTVYCPILSTTNFRLTNNHFSTIYNNGSPPHGPVGEVGPSTDCSNEILSGNIFHETGLPIALD
jgi:hypothetical protein